MIFEKKKNINGILISAGYSSRMGEPKALLEYNGFPFVINISIKLLAVCDKLVIVLGHNAEKIKNVINDYFLKESFKTKINEFIEDKSLKDIVSRIEIVENKNYDMGMFSSLKLGLSHCENADGFLFHQVDQPHLPMNFYKSFVNEYNNNIEWLQPEYKNRKGHPVLFNNKVNESIQNSLDNLSLRDVIRNSNITKRIWDCDFPMILEDIDNPVDYYKLVNH